MEGGKFLKQKLPELHKSNEVERAVKSHIRTKREKISNSVEDKIEVYIDRLEKLVLKGVRFSEEEGRFVDQNRKSFENSQRPRALFLLREKLMNKYVRNNLDKKTEGAVRVEERAARELGMGELNYNQEQRVERVQILETDLEKSLDAWILYFSDTNEPYPTWFRYYVFRNVLNMGDFDKEKHEFKDRSSGSAGLFPDIDRGALAYVEDMISSSKDNDKLQKLQNAQRSAANNDIKENEILTKERAEEFAKLSFPKQYVEAMKQNGEITPEMRAETRGKWIKYQQGTDPTALWGSLQNKGTAWCTKGYGTASTQLQSGDFYVYYTLDKKGEPTIPRIAIRMNGQNQIGEVRGVEDNQQNVEGNMMPILEEKFKDFGGEAEKYKKKSSDMKRLTEIDNKIQKDENIFLSKEELRFLYQVDDNIEGFGYKDDPRIKKILDKRKGNRNKDIQIMCDCDPKNIITDIDNINENTEVLLKDDGNKIQIVDFRKLGKERLNKTINLIQEFKKLNSPARPDLFLENGFVDIDINEDDKKYLSTIDEALKKFKSADTTTDYVSETFKKLPWDQIKNKNINAVIINHGETTPTQRDQMVLDMDKLGYRPATVAELTAIAIKRVDLFKKYPDPIFNSYTKHTVDFDLQTPYFFWNGVWRRLCTNGASSGWGDHDRFFFVRK